MRIGIECLLTEDWRTAQRLAQELEELNRTRRQVEGEMRAQADSIVQALTETDSNDAAIESDEVDDVIVQQLSLKQKLSTITSEVLFYIRTTGIKA